VKLFLAHIFNNSGNSSLKKYFDRFSASPLLPRDYLLPHTPDTAHSFMDKKELVQRSNWQRRLSAKTTGQPD
jgi:hypothetical protein